MYVRDVYIKMRKCSSLFVKHSNSNQTIGRCSRVNVRISPELACCSPGSQGAGRWPEGRFEEWGEWVYETTSGERGLHDGMNILVRRGRQTGALRLPCKNPVCRVRRGSCRSPTTPPAPWPLRLPAPRAVRTERLSFKSAGPHCRFIEAQVDRDRAPALPN